MLSSLSPAEPTIVFDTYWKFAAERQAIFLRRLQGDKPPWTADPILASYRFTNAYRASDRVSQYLIRNVLYRGSQEPDELFFRTILFKVFNRIGTWEHLQHGLGDITYVGYDYRRYDRALTRLSAGGVRLFSGAYIMPAGTRTLGSKRKHRNYLRLIERMMEDGLPARLADVQSMRGAFELLHSYPLIGEFLAYQYLTDINYSTLTNFSEMEFVTPGPGALSGIRKCFRSLGGLTPTEIIMVVAERQEEEFGIRGMSSSPCGDDGSSS